MNENFGVKGGKQDRIRTIKIKKSHLKKLQEVEEQKEIKELEEKVKKNQIVNIIKLLPIITTGLIYKTVTPITKTEEEIKEEIEIKVKIKEAKELNISPQELGLKPQSKGNEIVYIDINTNKELTEQEISIRIKKHEEKNNISLSKEKQEELYKETKEELTTYHKNIDTHIDQIEESINSTVSKEISNLKNSKILEEYYKKLKEIKSDLKKTIYEYNILVEESNELYKEKEAQELLDKLNYLIDKIEELQKKIKLPDINKYDDNYIYELVQEYIDVFNDKKIVKDIKDSNLYILISDKLKELDKNKDKLESKVTKRKEKLQLDEEQFFKLKEKYDSIESFNNSLLKFQYEQDSLLRDVEYKLKNAVSIEDKVEVQVKAMNAQSRRLMNLLRRQILMPGPKSAKKLTTATTLYMYFMRQLVNPELTTKKYKVIKVEDYNKLISNSIESLENVEKNISSTTNQLDKMIDKFKKDYSEYFGKLKECDELLYRLKKVKDELKDKESEINKIKEEQKNNLKKNNEKVLTLNNKKVN